MDYYIQHHGILGQKWGVRRYQNEDGSLTEMGRKKAKQYRDSELKRYDKKIDREYKDEKRAAFRKQKEYLSRMTDRELLDELGDLGSANGRDVLGMILAGPIGSTAVGVYDYTIGIPKKRARNFEQKFLTEHGNKTIHEIYEEIGYNPYSEREIKKLQRT
jgi:hypothetical protein